MFIAVKVEDSDIAKLKDKGYSSEEVAEALEQIPKIVVQCFAEMAEEICPKGECKKPIKWDDETKIKGPVDNVRGFDKWLGEI